MSTAREEILRRICTCLEPQQAGVREYADIERNYLVAGTLDLEQRLNLFQDRLRDYDAALYHTSETSLPQVIAAVLATRHKTRILIPQGVSDSWLSVSECDFVREAGLGYGEIDHCDGVLTDCAAAIAVTGTIVLHHTPQTGRRALSLIPDYHLCVVRTDQVVETVPEGIRVMASFGSSPITTISGPSATADIEMTRVKGVHGPRTLDVVLVENA